MEGDSLNFDDPDNELLPLDDSYFEDIVNANDSVASTALQEDSFSSFVGLTSTPQKTKTVPKHLPKKSSAGGPRLACTHCGRDYANERTLKVHMTMHSMKAASSRIPSKEALESQFQSILIKCLNDIISEEENNNLEISVLLKEYCTKLIESIGKGEGAPLCTFLCGEFHDIIKSQNALLPSEMRCSLYIKVNKLFCTEDFRMKLKSILLNQENTTEENINLLIGTLILNISPEVLIYVCREMSGKGREGDQPKKRSYDKADSESFQQLVYHIGGSVVYSLLRMGRAHPSSSTWQLYVNVMHTKFLRNKLPANECCERVTAFTQEKDRGGLKHLNQEAFDFFVLFFDKLLCCEMSDGSLPNSVVDDQVLSDTSVLCLWDELVGSELSEEQSLDLLIQTGHKCSRIVSKGIINRKLNQHLKQAYSSVALRAKLAR